MLRDWRGECGLQPPLVQEGIRAGMRKTNTIGVERNLNGGRSNPVAFSAFTDPQGLILEFYGSVFVNGVWWWWMGTRSSTNPVMHLLKKFSDTCLPGLSCR